MLKLIVIFLVLGCASAADLESRLLPEKDEQTLDALNLIFKLDSAGVLITAASKVGPAYASRVAGSIPSVEMRSAYRNLAKYLDLFGPCRKAQANGADGWWSSYPDVKDDAICSEAAKLLLANLLWTQVHYCVQLITGEVAPKQPGPFGPRPWRLDEPPVQTEWIKAAGLYRITGEAVEQGFAKVLDSHCGSDMPAFAEDCRSAVAELSKEPVNREIAALALAKVVLRHYESVHLRHLDRKAKVPAPSAQP